ncbi:Fc receptor-like protein 3 [Conger conger]|nr:Fc receptor-like protein 3 [Conger conger]
MFTGETVTLTCDISKGSGWRYSWMRKTKITLERLTAHSTESKQRHILHSVRESDSGEYFCQGERGQNPVIQSIAGSLALNVSGGKPKPVITQTSPSGEMYTGENVTLNSTRPQAAIVTDPPASVMFTGETVVLNVSATRPQAVIVTDPPASVMFTGETVTLTCDISKGSGWRYSWMRKTKITLERLTAHSTESQQRHILHSVRESDSGEYFCQGERGQNPVIQSFPGSLVLNVSEGKPKPVITQNAPSGEMYTGENVTLNCGFKGDPAGWEYFWYKDRRRTALPNTENSRSEGSSYTISPAALAHSLEYWCRAARGRNPFYSDYSDPLAFDISGENYYNIRMWI